MIKVNSIREGICNLCGDYKIIARVFTMQFCEECVDIIKDALKNRVEDELVCPFGGVFSLDFETFTYCEFCWFRLRCEHEAMH